ncbi:MAG: hypothetical protein ABS08_05280 [Actinobacteria bacterium BACL4 MAG-120507-bin0]|nr:MAG: hypothetical protein ABS08_05280 [Actinobacteria bacterium BACL4 MAG-120507-bin0]
MTKLIILSFGFLITVNQSAYSAGCIDKTCVDVFTSNNQLIITAQKGAAKPGAKSVPKSISKPISKPNSKPAAPKVAKPVTKVPKLLALPSAKPAPKPTSKPTSKPAAKPAAKPATKPATKPIIKKVAAGKKPTTASLSDRLIKMLPVGDINYQPGVDPLVNIPIYFWSQTPTRFTALVPILDVVVYVNLTPTFTWSYGDGGFEISRFAGAPYPIGPITHTYKKAGNYLVNLKITWTGTWSVNGVTTPIKGNAITQSISTKLDVVSAQARFIQ